MKIRRLAYKVGKGNAWARKKAVAEATALSIRCRTFDRKID